MQQNNKKLMISLAVLVVLIVVTWWAGRPSGSSLIGKDILQIGDTTSISRIEITGTTPQSPNIVLREEDRGWMVNDKYKADPAIMRSLMGRLLLSRAEQRVGASRSAEVNEWLQEGRQVKIYFEEGEELFFRVAGNPSKTESYLKIEGEEEIYQVEVPGYSMYIAGIFELTENQWRNRLIFSSDWRSIQSLSVDYTLPDAQDIEVVFDKSTLRVKGSEPTDTIALESYISNFESFFTNEYISEGQIPLYDSLMQADPVAILRLHDINASKNTSLKVYPQPAGSPYMLLEDDQGNFSVVEAARIRKLLPQRKELILQ